MNWRATLRALALCVVALGCQLRPGDRHPALSLAWEGAPAPPAGNNWPLPAVELERLFAEAPMEFVAVKRTSQGVAGAMKAEVAFPGTDRHLDVKWKVVPRGSMDGWNNNPRKEIAAYVVQRFFLAPGDYVVPTVAMHCAPIDAYRRVEPSATPTLPGTSCVLGAVTVWLRNVTVPAVLFDPQRFRTEPNYAYHLSNFNVLGYLVEHRDGRSGNILVADTSTNRRVFAVDNGISFGGLIYNFLATNWDVIRVPAIRQTAATRLRAVDHHSLDALGTLAELRADAQGVLRPVPPGENLDAELGVRVAPGRVQLGLTRAEIDDLADRIASLLERVDNGTLPVF